MNLLKYVCFYALLIVTVNQSDAQQLSWTNVEPGIWKAVAGKPEGLDLLKTAGTVPYHAELAELGNTAFPLSQADISAIVVGGKTYLRFPLDRTEQLYGFGLNFQTIHQRGKILTLHVDNYAGKDDGHTHCPTPFYVSSKG